MIKVEDALKIVIQDIRILNFEMVLLSQALNRVLAQDIYSDSDIPGFDNSAMDGFAVKSSDIKGALKNKPKTLKVIEDVKAGDIPKKILKDNQAIRIMTGAPIPKGADSVVMVEDTQQLKKEFVEILREVKPGENIRKAGEDIRKAELVINKGTLLNSGHIGVLASLGKSQIEVARKPRIAILATGNEVIEVDEKLTPGKLRSSNTYTLLSQILNCGGIPKNLGITRDKPFQIERKIRQGFDCDIILTSGGVSVGDYDFVKHVLSKMGTKTKFWQVAMRPGKPLVFGMIKNKPIFGLPGNPVSSMISFEIFVRPAILKMLGQKLDDRKEVTAVLEENIVKKKGLRYFLRAKTRWVKWNYRTSTTGPQGSGILKSMVLANSIIILPEEEEFVSKGTKVRVRFLQ